MRTFSIKQKLTLIIMTATTVALLLISLGFVAYELFTFQKTMRQDLVSQAKFIGDLSASALIYNNEKEAGAILAALTNRPHITSAAIYTGANHSTAGLFAWYPTSSSATEFPSHPEPDGHNKFDYKNGTLTLFQQIMLPGEAKSSGMIYLKSDLGEMRERITHYALMFAFLIVAISTVTYFLSRRLRRIISRPIYHLVETTRAISQGKNYSTRAQKYDEDELGDLIDNFNEMLSQIQQRDAELQHAKGDLEKRVQERTQDMEQEIVERKRAEAALQAQFTRMTLLNQITRVISERQDMESILYVVLRQLEDHLGIDLGVVCLFDHSAETLNVTAVRLKNPLLAPKLDLQQGTVLNLDQSGLRACKHGDAVQIPNTHKSSTLLAEKFAAAGFRAAAAVPLIVDNKMFGTLIVGRLAVESFSQDECDFLNTLSEHVALAAHDAQLHTELESAYHELRQTQQAVMQQERLKALGQMASGIAHDINNALSPVVGFADLLVRSEAALSANGKKHLHHIKTAGEDIAHIVARLREFYRQRDEEETLHSLNLNDLANQVIDMTRPRWRDIPQGRGIMIEMLNDLDANLPELVGIESEVREAMTNLVLNAVDAIPHGGTITVRTRTGLRDLGNGKPTQVILEISDTGIGMDEETRKHCLEPFYSTKGQRGTGLGLAMVYGVMERHGGQIEVVSERGQGTTMKLIFPLRRLASRGAPKGAPEEAVMPLRLLCIDDEPLLRELLRDILERDGHVVEVCDSGISGVESFRSAQSGRNSFDAIITDLGMPYFDGRQVAKTIKRESPDTPIIMLTGWGAYMKEDGEMPAQVDGMLSKPPRARELREMLRVLTQKDPENNVVNFPLSQAVP